MKYIALAALAATAAVAMAGSASAQTASNISVYGNLGYSIIDGGTASQFGVAGARIGARYGKYFGVEAEGGLGADGDNATISGVSVHTDVKHSVAGYAVGFYPVTPQVDLLARIGYGTTKIGADAAGFGLTGSQDSVNYGGGAQWWFRGKNAVRVEYTRLDFNHNLGGADMYSFGFVHRF